MVVTGIEKTRRGRYALMVDGEFLFSVHQDTFLTSRLARGLEMSPQELEVLREADERYSAVQSALDVLSRSAQSTGMLRDKLLRHYGEKAAEAALGRMAELGLLDDLDYARRLSRDMVNLRGWSLRRVRQGLLQRKLDRETVDEALRQFEDEDETGPIIKIILKKYRDKIFDAGSLRKTIAALQRRGFGYDDIRAALRRIQEEELWEDGSRK